MRAWFIGLMTLVPLGVVGASCALGSFEKVELPVDAGIDLGCQHATIPVPPLAEALDASWPPADADAALATGPEFTAAVRVLRLKYAADGGPLGIDLDRFCSCQGEPASCIPPEMQAKELSCDLPAGRDNQLTAFFALIQTVVVGIGKPGDELGELYSQFAELGRWTVLFRVTEYNGLPNDNKVRVEWYPSSGLVSDAGEDALGPPPPKWNGLDEWAAAPSSVTDPASGVLNPKFFDNDAYVTDGVLVFSLPTGELLVTNGLTQMALTISDGTVVARIDPYSGVYLLRDGIIAGRVSEENLFKTITDFRDHNGAPFCTVGNPYWLATRDIFCNGPDIQIGSPAPNKRCDAISLAIGFQADPAIVGGVGKTMTGQQNCPLGEDPLSQYIDAGCEPLFPSSSSSSSSGSLPDAGSSDATSD